MHFTHLLLLIVVLSGTCAAAAPQFVAPKTGPTVDQTFTVTLSTVVPAECIALKHEGPDLRVLVALDKLVLRARATQEQRFRSDTEELFKIADSPPGSSGCAELSLGMKTAPVLWLFTLAIEEGTAIVLDQLQPVPRVMVRFSATEGFGGNVLYNIPGQRPFGGRLWWVR